MRVPPPTPPLEASPNTSPEKHSSTSPPPLLVRPLVVVRPRIVAAGSARRSLAVGAIPLAAAVAGEERRGGAFAGYEDARILVGDYAAVLVGVYALAVLVVERVVRVGGPELWLLSDGSGRGEGGEGDEGEGGELHFRLGAFGFLFGGGRETMLGCERWARVGCKERGWLRGNGVVC